MTIRAPLVLLAVCVMTTGAYADVAKEEAIKKYLESQKGKTTIQGLEGPDYRTPEIYARPEITPEKPGQAEIPPADAENEKQIRPFGYDMFAAPNSDFFVPSEAPVPENYVFGPGDAVILNLWGRVEKTYELTIDREGKVFIPKSGEITLWGLTVAQAESKLREELSKIYSDFDLGLILGKIKSVKVYVFGAVKKPGAYTVSGLSTLFNVLYLSGGPDAHGSMRNIQLSRGGQRILSVDLYDVLLKGNNVDVRLANNDVIFVPVAASTATIRGCVKRPAIYELQGGERVRDLIELGGGLEADAYLEKITVSRIEENVRHVVLDVDLGREESNQNILIENGDTINVYAVFGTTERSVKILGHVKYPGEFAFREGMRINDMLSDQLLMDSYLDRANILRTNEDMTKKLIAVDVRAAVEGDTTANVPLRERDVISVYSIKDVQQAAYVSIEGEVRKESSYELTEDMRLSDLIFLAGGLTRSAYLLYAEVARVGPSGYSNIIRADLKECLEAPRGESDLQLQVDDKVFIREIPEWSLHDLVQINGEVKFPGRYALRSKHEMLSDLIGRAGGFTDNAFLQGTVFERGSIEEDIKRRNLFGIMRNLQEVSLDSLTARGQIELIKSLEASNMKRIVVDLDGLFRKQDKARDIELRDSDRIYVPPIPSGVHVLGAVASSGTIKHVAKKRFHYYVEHAGGLVKSADKSEMRIVKADGRVFKGRLSGVDIEIGDSIVVPKKIARDRDWWKILTNSFAIVSSAVTTAYLIIKL